MLLLSSVIDAVELVVLIKALSAFSLAVESDMAAAITGQVRRLYTMESHYALGYLRYGVLLRVCLGRSPLPYL